MDPVLLSRHLRSSSAAEGCLAPSSLVEENVIRSQHKITQDFCDYTQTCQDTWLHPGAGVRQRVGKVTLQDGSVRLYSVKSGEKHLEVSVATTPSSVPHGGAKVVSVCTQPNMDAVRLLGLVIVTQRPDHAYTHGRQRWRVCAAGLWTFDEESNVAGAQTYSARTATYRKFWLCHHQPLRPKSPSCQPSYSGTPQGT